MPKIEILSSSEQKVFDSPPQFSESECSRYFLLPTVLEDWLKTVGEPTNRVGFILLWGYCQVSSRFFQPAQFRLNDVLTICKQRSIDPEKINFDCYARRTFNSHKQKIRKHLGLMPFDADSNSIFLRAIRDRAARHQGPKQITHDVVEILKAKRIEIPGYNRFALAITRAIVDFEKGISLSLAKNLGASEKA